MHDDSPLEILVRSVALAAYVEVPAEARIFPPRAARPSRLAALRRRAVSGLGSALLWSGAALTRAGRGLSNLGRAPETVACG